MKEKINKQIDKQTKTQAQAHNRKNMNSFYHRTCRTENRRTQRRKTKEKLKKKGVQGQSTGYFRKTNQKRL